MQPQGSTLTRNVNIPVILKVEELFCHWLVFPPLLWYFGFLAAIYLELGICGPKFCRLFVDFMTFLGSRLNLERRLEPGWVKLG